MGHIKENFATEERTLTCQSRRCRRQFKGVLKLLCSECTARAKQEAANAPKTEKKYINGQFFGYVDHRNNSFVVINPGLSKALTGRAPKD